MRFEIISSAYLKGTLNHVTFYPGLVTLFTNYEEETMLIYCVLLFSFPFVLGGRGCYLKQYDEKVQPVR